MRFYSTSIPAPHPNSGRVFLAIPFMNAFKALLVVVTFGLTNTLPTGGSPLLCNYAHWHTCGHGPGNARTHAQQHIPDEARVGENCSMCTIWGRGAPRGPERGWDRNTIGATPSPPKWCTLREDGSRRGNAAALCVCCLSVDHRALVVRWNTQTRARAHTGNSRSLGPRTWPTHSGAL